MDRQSQTPNRTFVIGWPIHHSRSPLIHSHWLSGAGLEDSYERVPVSPEELSAFVGGLRNGQWRGGNVTLPHKEAVLSLADEATDRARRIGAANTLWMENGKLWADNTDGEGFAANLDDRAPGWDAHKGSPALVIGAGGAARGVVDVLAERGFAPIYIANRTLARAQKMADNWKAAEGISLEAARKVASTARLLVNTTSVGMDDDALSFDPSILPQNCVVTDIVYTPLETPLLAAAKARGLKVVDGLGMLLHQAVPGFQRWYGVRPEVTKTLRNIVLADMGEAAT